jgi:hypothetical protein
MDLSHNNNPLSSLGQLIAANIMAMPNSTGYLLSQTQNSGAPKD